MPALSAYSNTENTALIILKELGYEYWYDESNEQCCCVKDGWDFFANSFTELLGVVKIFEYHSPTEYNDYWWKMDEPWLVDNVPKNAPKYKPVWKRNN